MTATITPAHQEESYPPRHKDQAKKHLSIQQNCLIDKNETELSHLVIRPKALAAHTAQHVPSAALNPKMDGGNFAPNAFFPM
jgi:hypothetical protein